MSAGALVQQLLVIGYGNPYRGDDGFGPLAASLVEELRLESLLVIVARQLTPEMAIPLSRARYAIFFDAAVGDRPGALCVTPVAPCNSSSVTHYLEPGTLLTLAHTIFGRAPAASMITATAATLEHDAEISPGVLLAAEVAAKAVASLAAMEEIDHHRVTLALGWGQRGAHAS